MTGVTADLCKRPDPPNDHLIICNNNNNDNNNNNNNRGDGGVSRVTRVTRVTGQKDKKKEKEKEEKVETKEEDKFKGSTRGSKIFKSRLRRREKNSRRRE